MDPPREALCETFFRKSKFEPGKTSRAQVDPQKVDKVAWNLFPTYLWVLARDLNCQVMGEGVSFTTVSREKFFRLLWMCNVRGYKSSVIRGFHKWGPSFVRTFRIWNFSRTKALTCEILWLLTTYSLRCTFKEVENIFYATLLWMVLPLPPST